jgi:hypothetical protein
MYGKPTVLVHTCFLSRSSPVDIALSHTQCLPSLPPASADTTAPFCTAFLPSPSRPCSPDTLILLQTSVGSACILNNAFCSCEGHPHAGVDSQSTPRVLLFPLRYHPFSFDVARPLLENTSYSLSIASRSHCIRSCLPSCSPPPRHTPLSTFPLGRHLSILIAAVIRTPVPLCSHFRSFTVAFEIFNMRSLCSVTMKLSFMLVTEHCNVYNVCRYYGILGL